MGPAARRGALLYIWSGYGRGDRTARRGGRAAALPHARPRFVAHIVHMGACPLASPLSLPVVSLNQ